MVGDLDGAGDVLLAGGGLGEQGGHEVVGLHALDGPAGCGARPSTAARPGSGSGSTASGSGTSASRARPARAPPAPSSSCRKRGTSSSGKLWCGPRDSTTASSLAAAWSSKLNDRQNRLRRARPSARLIRPPYGRVDDQVHPLGLVEEPLEDEVVCRSAPRRARPGRRPRSRRSGWPTARRAGPPRTATPGRRRRRRRPRSVSTVDRSGGDLLGQLGGAGRRLARPERDGRRLALRRRPPAPLRPTTWRICQAWVPSRKMSPAMDSMAQSSLTVPTNSSSGSSTTRKSPISGMAPPR